MPEASRRESGCRIHLSSEKANNSAYTGLGNTGQQSETGGGEQTPLCLYKLMIAFFGYSVGMLASL
jgi:hypothetical protein